VLREPRVVACVVVLAACRFIDRRRQSANRRDLLPRFRDDENESLRCSRARPTIGSRPLESREWRALVDFLEEVDEELRSERYLSTFRRIAPWLTGVFAVLLLAYFGYWGYRTYQDHEATKAALAYEDGIADLGKSDIAGARTKFEAASKTSAAGYKTLALMQLGNLSVAQDKLEAAAKSYDAAAAAAPNLFLGDLARLKAAEALLDTAPLAQIQVRLQPLTADKRPYAPEAKEALALAELKAGRTADAKRDFERLMLSLDAPQGVRQRSQSVVDLINQGAAPAAVAGASAVPATPPSPAPAVAPKAGAGKAPPDQSRAASGADQ
jgi:hypothetical protein